MDAQQVKRRKKAKLSRTISWASAAAAVFVVVLLAGSMTGLFSSTKAEAPMAVRAIGEEAAPAPAAEEANFAAYSGDETVYEGCIVDEAPAEEAAPMEEAPAAEAAEEETAEEAQTLAAGVMCNISQNDFDTLLAELSAAGYHPEITETTFAINITKETADELNEIFSPYTDKFLDPGLTVYFSAE